MVLALDWRRNSVELRQAKKFIKQYKHTSKLGLTENAMCRIGQTTENTSQHILCLCKELVRVRLESIGAPQSDTVSHLKATSPKAKRSIEKREE